MDSHVLHEQDDVLKMLIIQLSLVGSVAVIAAWLMHSFFAIDVRVVLLIGLCHCLLTFYRVIHNRALVEINDTSLRFYCATATIELRTLQMLVVIQDNRYIFIDRNHDQQSIDIASLPKRQRSRIMQFIVKQLKHRSIVIEHRPNITMFEQMHGVYVDDQAVTDSETRML